MAFGRMAPLPGDDSVHALLATLCAITMSMNRAKGQPPTSPEVFMPWREHRRGRPRPSQVDLDIIEGLGRAAAANRRKKGKK